MKTIAPIALILIAILPAAMSVNAGAQESSASAKRAPTGLVALAQSDHKGPVVVIDMVKFKPGGETSYDKYDALAEKKLRSLGGEVVFRGSYVATPPVASDEWDRVTFRKYPTPAAVLAMGGSPEYQSAFPYRLAGVEKSLVYAFGSMSMPGAGIGGDEGIAAIAPAASDETVYMLNLLRFKPDGGRMNFFMKYGAASGPRVQAAGGGPVMALTGLTAVISDEVIDQLILVSYPSPKAFRDMITDPEYQKIMHLREDAIELGLIWGFSSKAK